MAKKYDLVEYKIAQEVLRDFPKIHAKVFDLITALHPHKKYKPVFNLIAEAKECAQVLQTGIARSKKIVEGK